MKECADDKPPERVQGNHGGGNYGYHPEEPPNCDEKKILRRNTSRGLTAKKPKVRSASNCCGIEARQTNGEEANNVFRICKRG